MSQTKCTPGPWNIPHFADKKYKGHCKCHSLLSANQGFCGAIADIIEDNGKVIFNGGNDGPKHDEAVANAYLMSAAPEMYDALENIVQSILNGHIRKIGLDNACFALAKARGES